jgi:hypothetical protein
MNTASVGAAEGCDLLILALAESAEQPRSFNRFHHHQTA